MALLPQPPELPGEPGDKLQHMLAFFTLGALAAAGWRHVALIHLFAWLALFGGAIETLQTIPILHRQGDPVDWIADMGAAALALLITGLLLRRTG